MKRIVIKRLNDNAKLPKYHSAGASGFDLTALEGAHIMPHCPQLFNTGIAAAIPLGYELQIRSRSGLALKGLMVANSPGTIDSDYRGEIGVILLNVTNSPILVSAGDRVAQAVLTRVERASLLDIDATEELSPTERGTDGFGSTGV